jgi:hypothetical protein
LRAEGRSGREIAQALNAQNVPAPGATWNRKATGGTRKRVNGEWVRTAILNNPLYKGEVVWGRSRWERSARDSSIRRWEFVDDPLQSVRYSDERLRIVSDELWSAAQAVQSARTPRSEAISTALRKAGRGPKHWLSSILVCTECDSNFVQFGRTDYVSSGFHNGASCTCGARFRIVDGSKLTSCHCKRCDSLRRATTRCDSVRTPGFLPRDNHDVPPDAVFRFT